MPEQTTRSPIWSRSFLLFWLTQTMFSLGGILYLAGVMVFVYERTGSALQTVTIIVINTLTYFLLSSFGGVLADRYSRKWIMAAMTLARSLLVGVLLLLVPEQATSVWAIYIVAIGMSAAKAFYDPARSSLVPVLIPQKKDLVQANSLVMTTDQLSMAVGFVLGGSLMLQVGFQGLVLLTLSCFAIAALSAALIKLPHRGNAELQSAYKPPVWQSAAEAISYLRKHDTPRQLLMMEIMEWGPHAIWSSALTLVFVQSALNGSPQWWGYLYASFYVGQLIGAIITTVLAKQLAKYLGQIIIMNAALFSVLTILLSINTSLVLAVILAFVFGPFGAMRDVGQDSLLQATVDSSVLGRVYALRSMFTNLNYMIFSLVCAVLADVISIRTIYFVGGLLYAGTALYALSRPLIRQGYIAVKQEVPAVATVADSL